MVDDFVLAGNNIILTKGSTKCRCEMTSEGRLKPVAKQTSEKNLFLSTGRKWVEIDLPKNARVNISGELVPPDDRIKITRGEYHTENGKEDMTIYYGSVRLSNDNAEDLARFVAKAEQKREIDNDKVFGTNILESYHNAKDRLKETKKNDPKIGNTKNHIPAPARPQKTTPLPSPARHER